MPAAKVSPQLKFLRAKRAQGLCWCGEPLDTKWLCATHRDRHADQVRRRREYRNDVLRRCLECPRRLMTHETTRCRPCRERAYHGRGTR